MEFNLHDKNGEYVASAEYRGTGENKKINNEVVILPGSFMAKAVNRTKKWNDCFWLDDIRQELLEEGYVEDFDDSRYKFIKPYRFTSPNQAACTVLGYMTTKAWEEFKSESNETLRGVYKSSK